MKEETKLSTYQRDDGWLDFEKLIDEPELLKFGTGARGIGKTFNAQRYWLKQALLHVDDWEAEELRTEYWGVFLRRLVDNLVSHKAQPFKLMVIDEALEQAGLSWLKEDYLIKFVANGKDIVYIDMHLQDKEFDEKPKKLRIGFYSALPKADSIRGADDPRIKLIILDEFQTKNGRAYYPKEDELILDIIYSLVRERDDFKFVAFSNSASIIHPIFQSFDYVEFDEEKVTKMGDVAFYRLANKPSVVRAKSRWQKLVSQTSYGSYSEDNEYADLVYEGIEDLSDEHIPLYCIKLNEDWYTVYKGTGRLLLMHKGEVNSVKKFTHYAPNKGERQSNEMYRKLWRLLQKGRLNFSSPDTKILAERALARFPDNRALNKHRRFK